MLRPRHRIPQPPDVAAPPAPAEPDELVNPVPGADVAADRPPPQRIDKAIRTALERAKLDGEAGNRIADDDLIRLDPDQPFLTLTPVQALREALDVDQDGLHELLRLMGRPEAVSVRPARAGVTSTYSIDPGEGPIKLLEADPSRLWVRIDAGINAFSTNELLLGATQSDVVFNLRVADRWEYAGELWVSAPAANSGAVTLSFFAGFE